MGVAYLDNLASRLLCSQSWYRKSRQALAGKELVVCDSVAGKLGVTICYDMRFPELYQKLCFVHGAQVLLMPSAFAMTTGEDTHVDLTLQLPWVSQQSRMLLAQVAYMGMQATTLIAMLLVLLV